MRYRDPGIPHRILIPCDHFDDLGGPWLLLEFVLEFTMPEDRAHGVPLPVWLTGLIARKPHKLVAVALANKNARIIWALLAKGGVYRKPQTVLAAAAA